NERELQGGSLANVIITGVDGSETAIAAAQQAADVARAFESSLHVVSAYGPCETRTLSDGAERVIINLRDKAERIAAEAVTALGQEFPDLEVTASIGSGNPAEVLVNEAERLAARLIVVGNKRVQVPTSLLSSVARSVAANATCDVYIANTHGN